MVRINLLSAREKKKRLAAPGGGLPRVGVPKGVPLPLVGGVVMLLLFALGVFLYFQETSRIAALEERIDLARQDSTRYSRAITKLREIESSQSAIATRIQAIREVDAGRFRWAHILAELSAAVPEYTWLTSVVQREDLEGSGAAADQIEITGVTYSNLTLTQFMTALESSPYLDGVSLIGSSRSTVDGVDVTSFALVASYTQPASS